MLCTCLFLPHVVYLPLFQVLKLSSIIAEADQETQAQQKQYGAIVNEQRVLDQQLIQVR